MKVPKPTTVPVEHNYTSTTTFEGTIVGFKVETRQDNPLNARRHVSPNISQALRAIKLCVTCAT